MTTGKSFWGPCGWAHLSDWPCDRCAWLSLVGYFALTVQLYAKENMGDQWTDYHDGLDAVAGLLSAHATTRRNHRSEMSQSARDGQRSATEAYNAGLADAQERMGL